MNYHVNEKNFSNFNVSLDCVKIHEEIIVKRFTLSLTKDSMNTIEFLNMGQENIQCIVGIYMKKPR